MNKEAYQVFISFKNTCKEIKTRDYELAKEVYNTLKLDYKVFFSPVTLEEEGISNWDREIEIALEESIIFIMVGTEREYIQSVNLVSERAVYLSLMKKDSNKTYFNYIAPPLTIDTLPHEIGVLQTFIHENIDNGIDRLCSFIKNHSTRIEELEKNVNENTQQIEDQSIEINNLKKQIGAESVSKKSTKIDMGLKTLITPNQNTDVPTLSVSNKGLSSKRWYESVQVDSAELLSFDLHYFTSSLPIDNFKAYIDSLDGKVFDAGDTLTVKGKLTADNLDTASGEVEVTFDEKVKLKLYSVSWQKWPCQAVSCESPINKNINNLFKNTGLSLGNISGKDDEYSGNLVISYRVTKVEAEPKSSRNKINMESLTTNSDPENIDTLLTNNKKGTRWLPNINIRAGDDLGFNIHYYGWHKGINDLNVKIDDLNGKEFKEDEIIVVNAVVSSKNLKSAYGQAKVIFDEPVRLKLRHISWQKNKCQSSKCETEMPKDSKNIFLQKGLLLGDTFAKDNNDYYGNIVVSYDVVKVDNGEV